MKIKSRTNKLIISIVGLLTTLSFSACGKKEFKVKGDIEGAAKELVILEKPDFFGNWILIDSTRTSGKGKFSMNMPSPAAPEIYRLEMGGRYIYFPVDSTETIHVKTTASDFGIKFSLSGSQNAETLSAFENEINSLNANIVPDSLYEFKRAVYVKYIQPMPESIVSYHILTRRIADRQLFDPFNDTDYKFFGAVATGYQERRPDDPHTKLLTETTLNARRKRNQERGIYTEIGAEEINLIDIELPDEKGNLTRLSDVAGGGMPTLLIFSLLTAEESPALNYQIEQLRQKRNGGLRIYNVALDPDRYAWREAAVNLPWVTVFDPDGEYSAAAASYNVASLPSFFIINSKGELADRAFTLEELDNKLRSF